MKMKQDPLSQIDDNFADIKPLYSYVYVINFD